LNAVKVEIVKEPPTLHIPAFAYGILTFKMAQEWGKKLGYPKVYWQKSRQRAYAEKVKKEQVINE
jgi:hypothetical protein